MRSRRRENPVLPLLKKHFGQIDTSKLTITERQFPFRVRPDLQRATEQVFGAGGDGGGGAIARVLSFCGVRQEHAINGVEMAGLLADSMGMAVATPPEYEETMLARTVPSARSRWGSGCWIATAIGSPCCKHPSRRSGRRSVCNSRW